MIRRLFLVVTTIAATLALAPPVVATVTCDGDLHVVPSPSMTANLLGVSMFSDVRGWSVGVRYTATGSRAVALRWNGTEWRRVPMATPDVFRPEGVFAADRHHVWAVGYHDLPNGGSNGSGVQFWDGSSWQWVDVVLPGGASSSVLSVDGSSATDVWVAGSFYSRALSETRVVAVHWDGVSWSRTFVPTPPTADPGSPIEVNGIAAVPPTEAWIVGESFPLGRKGFSLHWNGAKWSRVLVPDLGDLGDAYLFDVDGASASDVWSVGSYAGEWVVLHWNGVKWSVVLHEQVSPGADYLYGVKAVGPDEVWAVGSADQSASFPPQDDPAAIRFDGAAWAQIGVEDPAPTQPFVALLAVDATPSGQVFAVGGPIPGTYSVSGCMP